MGNLHETWQKYSNKIKAFGVSDYQSSQWVAQSNQRSLEWYSLLNVSSKNNAKIRFDSAPFPLFLKNKQKEQNEDEMKHQSSQQQSTAFCAISSHYVPLGIFHNQTNDLTNKHKVRWLEASPFSQALFDKQIEFRLKRLVHEPINNMEHILPYLHSQSYKIDATDKEFGYFPIDWVFAEIDFCNEQIEEAFTLCFKNYSPPLVDDQSAYNPFWFMQFPRIPLFVLSVRLPLNALRQYAVNAINEKYGLQTIKRKKFNRRRKKKKKQKIPRPKSQKNEYYANEFDVDLSEVALQIGNNKNAEVEMERFEQNNKKRKNKRRKYKGSKQEYTFVASKDDEIEEESDAMSESDQSDQSEEESEDEYDDDDDDETDGFETDTDSEYDDDEEGTTQSDEDDNEETDSSETEEDGTVTYKRKTNRKKASNHPSKHRNSSKCAPSNSKYRKPPKMRL